MKWWPFKATKKKAKAKPKPKPKARSRKGKEKAQEEVEEPDVEDVEEEKNELWCICNQVFVVGSWHGWECVVVIH